MSTDGQMAREGSVSEDLIALARNAHVNVDLDDPADYWYRLGQRNAYALSAASVIAGGVDEASMAVGDRITGALSDGVTDPTELRDAALGYKPDRQAPRQQDERLQWVGPVSFAKRYLAREGVDSDTGIRVGERRDQEVHVLTAPGTATATVYAYDRTWDEYVVLAEGLSIDAAESTLHELRVAGTSPTLDVVSARLQAARAADLRPSTGMEL